MVVVENAEIECLGGEIRFRIQASHFIWKRVRRVVGALVKVGLGELSVADFARLIDEPAKFSLPVAEWTAPASGLFEDVRYPERGPAPRKAPRGPLRVAFRGPRGKPAKPPASRRITRDGDSGLHFGSRL
jgi:tRNA pseudouridine38-40 synthase